MRASSRAKISNAHSLLDVGDARSPGHHRACLSRGEEKREEEEEEEGNRKGRRETGHSREDFEPRGEPCYISPERPCCFFNARTTFTPSGANERGEDAIEAFDDPTGRIDRLNDDRYTLSFVL